MKTFLVLALMCGQYSFAATSTSTSTEKEGDLNLPVADVSQFDRQEQEEIPTLDEVPMIQRTCTDKERVLAKSETNQSCAISK